MMTMTANANAADTILAIDLGKYKSVACLRFSDAGLALAGIDLAHATFEWCVPSASNSDESATWP
jgi:hypothetical protein